MPTAGGYYGGSDYARQTRAKEVRARLIARGLDPRGNGFLRAFFKAMKK